MIPPRTYASFLPFVASIALTGNNAQAQSPPAPGGLTPAPLLTPPSATEQGTLFLRADRIEGVGNRRLEASGDVELRSHFESFYADWLSYDPATEEIHARGNVRLRRGGDTVSGPELVYRRQQETGFFTSPSYEISGLNARGTAAQFQFTGPGTYVADRGTYTTCRIDDESWFLRVGKLEIDRGRDVGTARDATLVFHGTPILYSPWLTFPLGNERKSGFLTPSLGSTGSRGLEVSVPYYWNIAPNYDATITPHLMTRRGLQLNGQVRYLFADNAGEVSGAYLPDDRVEGSDRWGIFWRHNHDLGRGFGAFVNYNRVSDVTYFSDLGEQISVTSQTVLPQEGGFTYSSPHLDAVARVQKFQTLQDPNNPILPPYDRIPQLVANARAYDWHGLDLQAFGEYVSFRNPTLATGDRLVLYPWASSGLRGAAWSITGRAGVHMTHYRLDDRTLVRQRVDRVLPIASIDGGLLFERDLDLGGRELVQTLEPRAFYVYIPYRRQDDIPAFDTAIADLNFAQLFSENRYVGQDRINDANQITLAVTTRFLDRESGDERLRMAIGQRYYFQGQRVTLNEVPRGGNSSDIVFTAGGRLFAEWFADLGVQYGPTDARLERFNALLRYQPGAGRVLGAGYRYSRELVDVAGQLSRINQVDLTAQWPVYGNVTALGRWNYSFYDRRTLEAIAGIEYNADCWVLRVVGHRLLTATQTVTNSVFVQLELNGVSRIGTNPLDLLRRNIPGYSKTNEPTAGDGAAGPVYDPRF